MSKIKVRRDKNTLWWVGTCGDCARAGEHISRWHVIYRHSGPAFSWIRGHVSWHAGQQA